MQAQVADDGAERALEHAIRRFLETAAENGYSPQAAVDASMIGLPNSNAEQCRSKDKQNTLGEFANQASNTSLTVLRRLAPYGLQMAVSAATYSMGLGLFQVLGYGLRVSCSTPFVSSCLGCLGVGVSSAVSAHMTRHVQRQLDAHGPLALLTVPPWSGFDPDDALVDAVLGVTVFKFCSGQFRRVMPSNLTHPGAWAVHSLPIAGAPSTTGERYATGQERDFLKGLLKKDGCHHCGTRVGKLHGDHIPPTKLFNQTLGDRAPAAASQQPLVQQAVVQMRNFIMGNPHAQRQRLFPQCSECSGKQGAFVGSGKGNPLVMHWRLWRVTPPGFLPGVIASLRPVGSADGPGRPHDGARSRGALSKARQSAHTHSNWMAKSWWQSSLILPARADGGLMAVRGSALATPLAQSPRHVPRGIPAAAAAAQEEAGRPAAWGDAAAAAAAAGQRWLEGGGAREEAVSTNILAWTRPMDESWPCDQSGVLQGHPGHAEGVWVQHTSTSTQHLPPQEAQPSVSTGHLTYTHLTPLHIGGHHVHTDIYGQGSWWDQRASRAGPEGVPEGWWDQRASKAVQGSCEVAPASPMATDSPKVAWKATHASHGHPHTASHPPAPAMQPAGHRGADRGVDVLQPQHAVLASRDILPSRGSQHARVRSHAGGAGHEGAGGHVQHSGPKSHAVISVSGSLKRHRYTSSETGDDVHAWGAQQGEQGAGVHAARADAAGSAGASGSDQLPAAGAGGVGPLKAVPNGMLGRMVQGLGRGLDQALTAAVGGAGAGAGSGGHNGAVGSPPVWYVQSLHI